MKYRVNMSAGVAGRLEDDDNLDEWENPKYGFYWWFSTPNYNKNNGKFSRNEVVDITIHWLCFWVSLTFWPNKNIGVSRSQFDDFD